MRRTYRSKKDTDGCLDHKDVFLSMDNKSSVFDAFYIQNIKQTKKELLCAPTSKRNNNTNKVRKRKYVKRIDVKKPDIQIRESSSRSTYLTPDKSIHVNKAPDLFDQLLNTVDGHPKSNSDKNDPFNEILPKSNVKTYGSRKLSKLRKFNYSSTDCSTDSEKENTDTTDIGTHNLVIEKESKPNIKDDSIFNIVNDLSFLHKLKSKNNSKSFYNSSIKRRQKNSISSPILQSLPFCSTPFSNTNRSQSIYKLSPIAVDNINDSPMSSILKENVNNSIIFHYKSRNKETNKILLSPVSHLQHTNKIEYSESKKLVLSGLNNTGIKEIENALDIKPDNNLSPPMKTDLEAIDNNTIEPVDEEIVNDLVHNTTNNYLIENKNGENNDSLVIFSSINGTVPSKLFLGFSEAEVFNHQYEKNSLISYNNIHHNSIDNVDDRNEEPSFEMKSVIENTMPSQPFLGFSNVQTYIDISSESDSSKAHETRGSESEIESSYGTCNSNNSSKDEDSPKKLVREPVIKVEKMSNSIFQKYYDKITDYISEDESISSASRINASLESRNSLHSSFKSVAMDSDEGNASEDIKTGNSTLNISKEIFSNYSSDSSEDNSIEDKEQSIIFVTRRRKNDTVNNNHLCFNKSYESEAYDCDEAVQNSEIKDEKFGNHKNDSENKLTNKSEINVNENIELGDAALTRSSQNSSFASSQEMSKSSTITNSSTLKDKVNVPSPQVFMHNNSIRQSLYEGRPGIVLQPGKKWERSLSIYKRMSMMADPLNNSVLNNELMCLKGRNYRHSVINTMEMQGLQASLHNETINSRRSIFVSKPSRSTIRIVKESNISSVSLCTTSTVEELSGFLSEDCDDTIVELSKLSIADDHEITVLEKIHDTSGRVATARDYVLRRCNQTEAILFDECYPDTVLKNCHKIGEGVYGEVFLWRARDGRARVMKIVPVAGTIKVNGEDQKDFHEIISEIVIAMELSALRAPIAEIEQHFEEGKDTDTLDLGSIEYATDVFNEVLAVRCVYGAYPSRLVELWELWDECRGSDNDHPGVLPAAQHFVVLELANAGHDLESFEFGGADQAHALLLQVAFGLAVAEEAFQFEHRDLHWGNVLIAPTDQKWATFVLRGRVHRVRRRGVAATVIDYSLSRLSLPLAGAPGAFASGTSAPEASAPGPVDSALLYNDLATDDTLFDALGDYQFDVYRLMRDKLGNDWKNFEPYTNILWLHYIVDKMITALRYKRTNTKVHKQYIAKLKGIKNRILCYGSAAQFVLTDNELI